MTPKQKMQILNKVNAVKMNFDSIAHIVWELPKEEQYFLSDIMEDKNFPDIEIAMNKLIAGIEKISVT